MNLLACSVTELLQCELSKSCQTVIGIMFCFLPPTTTYDHCLQNNTSNKLHDLKLHVHVQVLLDTCMYMYTVVWLDTCMCHVAACTHTCT